MNSLSILRRSALLSALLLVQPLGAQTVISVGSGSYASSVPASEANAGDTTMPPSQVEQFFNILRIDPSQAGKPVPTNHWWSDLIFANRSSGPGANNQYTIYQAPAGGGGPNSSQHGNQWFIPGMIQPMSYGIDVYYANSWKAPNADGSPQGTIDKGTKLAVKGDVPYGFLAADTLIADFENGYPAGSTITGNAFPTPPSPGSGIGNLASTRLASTRDGGNGVQGVLSLPNFTINKHYLHFQICGGNTSATQVRLVINGATVLAANSTNSTNLQWVSWDMTPCTGQTGHIEIVDASTAAYGFIAADQIFLSDAVTPAGRFGGDLAVSYPVVTKWGDWNVDFSQTDTTGHKLETTMTRGVPFTWTRWTNMKPKLVLGAATTFLDAAGNPITVTGGQFTATSFAMVVGGKNYGVYLPDNTVCLVGGTGTTSYVSPQLTGGTNNYLVIGYLPATSNLSTFGTYAYARPTNTALSWTRDAVNGRVNTTWTVTATAMKGTNTQTIQGFLPHQYRTSTTNFSFQPYTYQTQRGIMKMGIGNSFQVNFPFSGLAVALPAPATTGYTNNFDAARMQTYLNNFNPGSMLGNTYDAGKALNQCAKFMVMANEMGDTTNFNRLKTALTNALQNWLTYTPGENNGFYARYAGWNAFIGFDVGYGSQGFNDLHFHYGYHIIAAAQLAKYDKTFLTNYGPMLRLVMKSFANDDRADTTQPFLRTLDVWEGHSNAGGMSSGNGENQESSSEAMNSWVGIYLLGSMMNDSAVTSLGAMGFAMEGNAINEYWEDLYQTNFPASFNKGNAGMVWSDNFTYGTYFSGDPAWVYAIQYVPSAHWNNYLTHGPAAAVSSKYAAIWNERTTYLNSFETWNATTAYAQYSDYVKYNSHVYYANVAVPAGEAAPGSNPHWSDTGDYSSSSPDVLGAYPGNYVFAYQALWDHANTPAMFDTYYTANKPIAKNNTYSGETYYLIHALRQLGDQDYAYSASVPTAAVYLNSTTGIRKAVIYNPGTASANVALYKGGATVQTVTVPANSSTVVTVTTVLPPSITSALTKSGTVGTSLTYQIVATNTPTSYAASPLPAGLGINTTTGAITGIPTAAGTTNTTITATNAGGSDVETLVFTIAPAGADTNIALNVAATSASSFQTGNDVFKGNDGSGTSRWAAVDGTFPQWWQVDFGANKVLSRADIDWLNPTSRAYKYKIETATAAAGPWTLVVDKTANTVIGNSSDPFVATARYVKITVTGSTTGGFASAYEFKIFGH